VVCSLEPWDDVWRRNQFFVECLISRGTAGRVLFVEPPVDALFDLACGRRPSKPHTRSLRQDGRLHVLRPMKFLPRRLGPLADRLLHRRVIEAAHRLALRGPVLWINDVTYAPLIQQTGWPALYDITDDWLLAPFASREIDRLRGLDALAMAHAREVVVCSPTLEASRGASRPVTLIGNAVDSEHFRRPRARPTDLAASPTAVYVGTLHESRLDVDLVSNLAQSNRGLAVVLVGPDALDSASRRKLRLEPNVEILGKRPYRDVPAYLQHADVIVVPHRVTPFTDSLDPIKAYECLAVQTPTVATPVAGFRELASHLDLASRETFVEAVLGRLQDVSRRAGPSAPVISWNDRIGALERVLARVRDRGSRPSEATL
jgi:glycosyltransferase involved in cell wall biosynthesis